MLKRILACGLCTVMAFSLLTGCRAPAANSSAGSNASGTIPAAAKEDVDSYLTNGTFSNDDTVMTVNHVAVPASAYFYWMAYYASTLKTYYQDQKGSDSQFSLSDKYQGNTTYADYVKQQTEATLTNYIVAAQQAKAQKLSLSKAAKTALSKFAQTADPNTLLYYATNLAGMKFNYTNDGYSSALQSNLFGKGGKYYANKKTLSDYFKDNVFGAKHILITTTGMTDAQKAAAKKTITGYLDKILKSDDPVSTFEQYMKEYSQDPGLKTYPNGYTYMKGDMISQFEDAVSSLKIGKIDPQIVETSYGYHIIMRIEPDRTQIKDKTLQEDYQKDIYNGLLANWTKKATVTTSSKLKQLDTNAFYETLTSLQGTIDTISQAKSNSSVSSTPSSEQSAQ